MIPQTSASDRYEAARKALGAAAMYGVSPGMSAQREASMVLDLVDALRALITPPGVGEGEEEIANTILLTAPLDATHRELAVLGIRAGIQYAHESWESDETGLDPETALRYLGIEYTESTDDDGEPSLLIREQHVSRGY